MKKKIIAISGIAGCGKTYLAKKLSLDLSIDKVISLDLLTEGIWERLTMPTVQLPPILQKNNQDATICPSEPRHTDVFLFGIPSTGKTCVLMGLLDARNVLIQNQLAGGKYSNDLRLYLRASSVILSISQETPA